MAICQSPELASLDMENSQVFNQAKAINRHAAASASRQFLRDRRACGSNAACIRQGFIRSIAAYHVIAASADIRPSVELRARHAR